ncbi:MAG TPA: energy transducer TonB, partial [Acidobacteriota bacterium]|nr:energy transducer TonB [Acidobacteriota bacterium]
PPPPPPPPIAARAMPQIAVIDPSQFVAPKEIPREIPPPVEEAPMVMSSAMVSGIPGGIIGGVAGGITGGVVGGLLPSAAKVAPPPPPKPVKREAVRIGGNLQESRLIRRVEPDYPEIARRARIQGDVVMQADIDEEGNVTNLRTLSGHQLLRDAAEKAVSQWKYSPYLLNGEPVPVIATVTVRFILK